MVCINNSLGSGDGFKTNIADYNVQVNCKDVYAGATHIKAMLGATAMGVIAYIWNYMSKYDKNLLIEIKKQKIK